MIEFVKENFLLMLTTFGAAVSFLATFIGLVSQKKRVTILATLAILGFIAGIAFQVFENNLKQEDERRKADKENIRLATERVQKAVIDEIHRTVQQTKITVDSIAEQLNEKSIKEVATELVSLRSRNNVRFEETMEFQKGTPGMWDDYAAWLTSFDRKMVAPSLSLTVNAGRSYYTGLLLAYLLTGEATRGGLEHIVKGQRPWEDFPAEEFYIEAFRPDTAHIQWVLFHDGRTRRPVAYADAKTFTQELMVYHRLKKHRDINTLLRASGQDAIARLQAKFPSIETAVFMSKSPAELVKIMIDKELAVSVTTSGKKIYVVKLVQMIQFAAKKD